MTVLSLKLSRVLDVNTQNALELFVGKIKIKKKKKKKQKFLLLQRQVFVALLYLGIAICGNSQL